MKLLGIDLGSRAVKIAVMQNSEIIYKEIISTISFYKNYCKYNNGKIVVDLKKIKCADFDKAVSTGYGRNNTDLEEFKPINEIKAHVYGALYQTNLSDFILLDVGGQDVKAVKVEKKIVIDLELNDKCAASCGRYLENMANVLEISLDEMGKYYEEPVRLNSTCAVFSESELIGKIAEGIDMKRLCAGVNYSLYKRILPMLKKFNDSVLLMSGGASNNQALIKYLQKDYEKVTVLQENQFNGAIGCCYYAHKFLKER
ncbi:2-hydroxyglutaryl-CoA dehydratase [Vallitalea longa]|uniref:2-hydroxyglutaryl-CoA dehydratase n=1 Tax=Vallitalea longa TaxID=2936439 RepID=A0A9W5YAJ4_9FIRM|nr:acyl-CoA dehydratase activase [Vallitalea longa]GKX28838.1 2-hydroxyglutaryl-CoA dehydratase [Vallitalea longa]